MKVLHKKIVEGSKEKREESKGKKINIDHGMLNAE